MPLYTLSVHYACTREPHVVTYASADEAFTAAEHRRKTGAGVSAVVVSAGEDLHPGLAGGPIFGSQAVLEGRR